MPALLQARYRFGSILSADKRFELGSADGLLSSNLPIMAGLFLAIWI